MDLRPQGPEIIRTWLFDTIVRSHFEHGQLPWAHATINGWILDPDRKKMSKSKGNVVTPVALLDQYGTDAVRYWSTSARPGVDTALDEGQMKIGRRLAIKILNASRFVLGLSGRDASRGVSGGCEEVGEPLDRALLAALAELVGEATDAFEAFDYARALERTEAFFWSFCDDYLELVKGRAYGGAQYSAAATRSARVALELSVSALLRLFAPFLPFVTEEVWSWWQDGSVHRASWPDPQELAAATGDADPLVRTVASEVLQAVRRTKSDAKRSMRAPVERVVVTDTARRLRALSAAAPDVREAGAIALLDTVELADGAAAQIAVTLQHEP